jgi:periplasmic copper chaperone A
MRLYCAAGHGECVQIMPNLLNQMILRFVMNKTVIYGFLMVLAGATHAQVRVNEAWVRATVPQQKATGAFMQVLSAQDARLLSVSSPVAGVAEVHEMALEGDVMKMRALPFLALPAGQAVELKPGGYHIMLMDLKAQVKAGDTVPVILTVQGKDGKQQKLELQITARSVASPGLGQSTSTTLPAAHSHKH